MEIGFGILVTMYIIMLGPVKLILPFAHSTAHAPDKLRKQIAFKATVWGACVAFICLAASEFVVQKFLLSDGTLMIAISFFLAAFAYSLAHVGDPAMTKGGAAPPENPSKDLAIIPLAFPGIIPPQGFGLLVLSTQLSYVDAPIDGLPMLFLLTALMMIANYGFMIGARAILKFTGRTFWILLVRFLSPLFIALSIHIFLRGLEASGIVNPTIGN